MAKSKKQELSFEVHFARKWKDGGITFALDLPLEDGRQITIYGCRIAAGRKSNFISFPSRKGTDNKYYSYAYVELSQDEKDEIIEAVMEELKNN